MFRFLWVNSFMGVFTPLMILWGVLVALWDPTGRRIHRYAAVPWAKCILWAGGIRWRVLGLEHLHPGRPAIYMANHQSYFDIFALLAALPVDFKFIMKQELMRIPLLGMAMRRAGYIGLERKDPRQAVASLQRAAEKIRSGLSILVFPEGTRSRDGRLRDFKRGGFNLALRAGCDIVPVTIEGSYRIVSQDRPALHKTTVTLHLGTPIAADRFSKRNVDALVAEVRQAIAGPLDEDGAVSA